MEEDITDIKDVLRKAISEIEELKQEVREITPLRRKIRSLEVENSLLRHKYGNLAEEVKALRDVVGREYRRNNDSGVHGEVETSPSRPRIRKYTLYIVVEFKDVFVRDLCLKESGVC